MADSRKVAPRRGDVFLVSFDPTLDAEIKKTRPALVLARSTSAGSAGVWGVSRRRPWPRWIAPSW
ncbi:MAG: hypothetical protein DMD79_25945 [Candidatus Rokuibacteriota bacterium]|nr:MAG: hypothetical protein DMD79_25945 [Candidatus Rokubacteria bacterium]